MTRNHYNSAQNRGIMMLKNGALILLLACSGFTLAQGNGNGNANGQQDRPARVTGLERAAERHALKAERVLAEGKALLRGPGFAGKSELHQRQNQAEGALRGKQQLVNQLLARARGNGSDAVAAEAELTAMLAPATLLDTESRLTVATAEPLASLTPPSSLRSPPDALDLQGTLDARLSPAIEAKAIELGKNPVAIHEWVRKNVRLVPTRGSTQGAEGTLATQMGNATDIASLTVALLRASNIHARYVRGQIAVDAQRAQRWLGVDSAAAVQELLTEGGVAFETTQVGSTISRFKLEHVWVEAYVDMAPSRGARHITGDAWVAMDPSFKDLSFQTGADLMAWMNLDAASMAQAFTAVATLDQVAGTLSALNADTLAQYLDQAVARLQTVLTEHALNDPTLNQLLARGQDNTADLPYLPGTYPYQIVSARTPEASLPETERLKLSIDIDLEDNGLPGAQYLVLEQPLVALYGQPLSLDFAPASSDDAAVLTSLMPSSTNGFIDLPESVPAYLVNMQGRLSLGTVQAAQSGSATLGRGLFIKLALIRPDGSRYEQDLRGHVGANRSFDLGWNQGISAELADRLATIRLQQSRLATEANAAAALSRAALSSLSLGHLSAANTYQDWLAGLSRVSWYRTVSITTSYVHLEVDAPFGLILGASPQGIGVSDVSPQHVGAALTQGNESRFAQEALSAQSAFGYQLLEQMADGGARSATRVFLKSLADQQPIHTLRPNQITAFDALSLPTAVKDPLRAGLVAGDRATFTAEAREVNGWRGYGAMQNYPNALGGTSFVFGQVDADAQAHRTGAWISTLNARGLAYASWLGADAPVSLRTAWQQPAETFLAAGDGLVHLSQDPRALALSPTLTKLIAGTVIDHAVQGRVDPLIDQHLWSQMLWPELSIAPLLDPIAPTVMFSATPLTLIIGESTTLSASITDNKPGASLSVTADGQPITLNNGQANYTPARAGLIPLLARGRDAAGNVVEKRLSLSVSAPNDADAPQVKIHAPSEDSEVTQPTDVTGTVSDVSLDHWVLSMRPGNSTEQNVIILAQGTSNQGVPGAGTTLDPVKLATLDPTMLFNGVYLLTLQAWDAQGRDSFDTVQVRLTGDMKLGQFSISFVDAEIALQGIPIRITRTYDTRQSLYQKDFGYGWTIDYQNVRIRESRKMGFSWRLVQEGAGLGDWCVRPNGNPVVSVTLPDGSTEEFRAKFSPECSRFVPTTYGSLVFEPVNGKTQTKLEQTDYGQIRWANLAGGRSDLIDVGDPNLAPIDPRHYKLTTEDGMVYELDQSFGVKRVTDEAGNQITYSADGIEHSTGVGVQFHRDPQGRIDQITLPDGRQLHYAYTPQGDLEAMRDQLNQSTRYAYLNNVRYPHYLQDIFDPRGVRAIRNEYNDEGRLVATVDADGERTVYTHDIAGRVERIKNRRNFETTYVFDDNGWVLSETNALGEQTVYEYDDFGNVTKKIDPLERPTEFRPDPRGNVVWEKDAMGGITQRTFGSLNQQLTEIDALNRPVVTNVYIENQLTGALTNYLAYSEDALGNKTQTPHDICGGTGCGNTGNLKSIIDPMGQSTLFDYDSRGNVRQETDAENHKVVRTYDAMGQVKTETRTRKINGVDQSLVTTHEYDAKGQLKLTTYPDGTTSSATYNAIGKVETQTNAAGRVTRYEYDNQGRQFKVIYPDQTFDLTEFDEEGNEVAKTDRLGRTTRMVYDAANRLTETIFPDATPNDLSDNPRTKSEYDDAGQLIASIDELGHRTEYEYDLAGRQVLVRDHLRNETTAEYDLSGRRLSTTDALGRTVKFEYDLAGRLLATVYPDPITDDGDDSNNPRVQTEYDKAGRKTAEIDELGRRTEFGYDKLSRLTTVKLAAHTQTPLITRYVYDEQGNKTQQIDALNRVTEWTYDKQGRNLTRKLPMGQVETFGYNAEGERTSHTTFNNEQMTYAYDDLGRIDTITFPDLRTRTFTCDPAGRITAIDDRGEVYGFAYDERDRLIEARDARQRKIGYGYDSAGNRTLLTTPTSTVSYQFDELNRLKEVSALVAGQTSPQKTTYRYDAVGNRSGQTHANGSTVEYQYDRRNRLSQLLHKTAAGALMLGLAYQVDASGLRTGINETRLVNNQPTITRQAVYQYDALKRLTNSSHTVPNSSTANVIETFVYDEVGNRKTRTCTGQARTCSNGTSTAQSVATYTTTSTYDSNDRLSQETFGSTAYTYDYDQAGNLLSKKQGSTVLASYTWDIENRMLTATMTPNGTSGNRTTTRYTYDPNGIRRSSEVIEQIAGASPSVTKSRTDFLIDANQAFSQVLEDWTSKATQAGTAEPTLPDTSLQNAYVYGDDLLAEARYALIEANGTPASTSAGNEANARIGSATGTSSYHYDGLGSTRLLSAINLDANGNAVTTGTTQNPANETVTDQYAYTAFGEADAANTGGTTENNYRYTGEQFDPNLGFYYLRARYLNPNQGRFVGMDSWMGNDDTPATLNKYLYGNGQPVSNIDPTGLLSQGELTTAQKVGIILFFTAVNVLSSQYGRDIDLDGIIKKHRIFAEMKMRAGAHARNQTRPRNDESNLPYILFGQDVMEVSSHIEDAILREGLPAVLSKREGPEPSRDWYRNLPGCKGKTFLGSGKECDEYPMASTDQGGKWAAGLGLFGWRGSVRAVNQGHNNSAGRLLKRFYQDCDISTSNDDNKGWFAVIPMPFYPKTEWDCGND